MIGTKQAKQPWNVDAPSAFVDEPWPDEQLASLLQEAPSRAERREPILWAKDVSQEAQTRVAAAAASSRLPAETVDVDCVFLGRRFVPPMPWRAPKKRAAAVSMTDPKAAAAAERPHILAEDPDECAPWKRCKRW